MFKPLYSLTLLLPRRTYRGGRTPVKHFRKVEQSLVAMCGGFTRLPNVTTTSIAHDGVLYRIPARHYTATLPLVGYERVVSVIAKDVQYRFSPVDAKLHVIEGDEVVL